MNENEKERPAVSGIDEVFSGGGARPASENAAAPSGVDSEQNQQKRRDRGHRRGRRRGRGQKSENGESTPAF